MKKYVFLLFITALTVCIGSVTGNHEIRQPTKSSVEKSFVKGSYAVSDINSVNSDVDGIVFIAVSNGSLKYVAPKGADLIGFYNGTYEKKFKVNNKSLANLNWKLCARHKC